MTQSDMRIYFVGSHSTGKTTLARTLADRLGFRFQEESARQILRENGLRVDDLRKSVELTNQFQTDVLERQWANETHLLAMGVEDYVCDRGFDNMAYAAEHASNLYILRHSVTWGKYRNLMCSGQAKIFFLRPEVTLLDNTDPDRETVTWKGMQRIDAVINCIMNYEGMQYKEIPVGMTNLEDRVTFVLGNIQ